MPERDPQDERPDQWSPDSQIVFIDPETVHVRLFTHPVTGQLAAADLIDANGDLVVQLDVPEDAADTIFLTPVAQAA